MIVGATEPHWFVSSTPTPLFTLPFQFLHCTSRFITSFGVCSRRVKTTPNDAHGRWSTTPSHSPTGESELNWWPNNWGGHTDDLKTHRSSSLESVHSSLITNTHWVFGSLSPSHGVYGRSDRYPAVTLHGSRWFHSSPQPSSGPRTALATQDLS